MALKILYIQCIQDLSYLENFPSIVEIIVHESPNLERISNLPNLQKLSINNCPMLKVLESIPALQSFVLVDYGMGKLPDYIRSIAPSHVLLGCRLGLLALLAVGQSGTEWDKFSHVDNVKAYAGEKSNPRKWYVWSTRHNGKLDSNISRSVIFEETLSSSMVDIQGFESMYRMRRSTFSYICSLVRVPFWEDMMARDHTFVDGKVMSLQDGVAVALRVLSSGEPPEIIGSSIGVDQSTASLVTQVFVEAMWERVGDEHARWPHSSSEMEKIKSKFDKIHGLPNCCGVLHTAHIKFGSKSHDHEDNAGILLQIIIDPDMRFTDICLVPSSSMNQCSILQDSMLFKECEEGLTLNGSMLKVSSGCGSEVGEYIIGDAGYPLRPSLLTPYQLDNGISDSDCKKEFNRRHSVATSIVMQRASERFKETWKFQPGDGWLPNNQDEKYWTIQACCLLHNIVIDMEEEGGSMPSDQHQNKIEHVHRIADEDAVKVRDALSKHLMESGDHTTASEEEQQVPDASSSGDENKEQSEAFRRQRVDKGKEKVQDF